MVSTCYTALFIAVIGTKRARSGRERKMSQNGAVMHEERRQSLPRAATRPRLGVVPAGFKGTRITLFMIPLEETSQAGFCFSAMNG